MKQRTDAECETILQQLATREGTAFDALHCQLVSTPARIQFPAGEIQNPELWGYMWAWGMMEMVVTLPMRAHQMDGIAAQGMEPLCQVDGDLATLLLAWSQFPLYRRRLFW